ncbi:hypothetical protein Q1695_002195 [Nippostrongylus brasiliensis]|nr:hypothetical protein Q1695_002195 [Nippostrongylus brasiliensis]
MLEQLQTLLSNGRTPGHVKLFVELLLETRAEVKIANERNAALMEEVRALREENLSLKRKLADVVKPLTPVLRLRAQ